jgi:DNA-binding NarL/FixJ family response regulator
MVRETAQRPKQRSSPLEESGGLRLTPREQEVLRLLTLGKCNKEIANSLSITERTAKFHVKNLLLKFRVSTRMELLSRFTKQRSNMHIFLVWHCLLGYLS